MEETDLDTAFLGFINSNLKKLCDITRLSSSLLSSLEARDILRNRERQEILSKSGYAQKVELWENLRYKAREIEDIIAVLKQEREFGAASTLEAFPLRNPNGLPSSITPQPQELIFPGPGPSLAPSEPAGSTPLLPQHESIAISSKLKLINNSPSSSSTPQPLQQPIQETPRGKLRLVHPVQRDSSYTTKDYGGPLPDIIQRYASDGKYKGVAIIINVVTFSDEPSTNRLGAEKDTQNLTDTLFQYNFLVYNLVDPSYQDLVECISQVQSFPFDNADSLFIAVMSHGDGERIKTHDGRLFKVWSGLVEKFNNVSCKGLKGKPKVFLFNYCRGDVTDTGTRTQHDGIERSTPATIPSWTDMLVCYSTLDGHYAYRDVSEGSWFIQTFCQVLKRHAKEYDILKLLSLVSEVMMARTSENGEKQICPYYNIGFTKEFYFGKP